MAVYINIGSNCGDRHALIGQAVAALARAIPGKMRRSSFIETEPRGFSSPNKFLNLGVLIEPQVPLAPLEYLRITQAIERSISPFPHRDADGRYIDREIDIDIIDIDGITYASPELTLPHPRARERDFVITPWTELLNTDTSSRS